MTRQADTYRPLENIQIPVQIKLAAAWTSFVFLYLYVDHLVLYKPGVVDGILAGMIWEFEVSQTFMIAAFISVAIPAIMILLSMTLPVRVVRVTNLVVASLNIPYAIFNAVGESWTYFFGLSIGLEVLVLAFILRSAWTWPRTPSASMSNTDAAAHRQRQQAHA
jgi:hypothetical protein